MENNVLSASDVALLSEKGGMGDGNAFIWIFGLLILLGLFNGGFGGFNNNNNGDLQRAVDLNSIQEGQADIRADVQRTAYEQMVATKDAQLTNLQEIRDNGALISAGNANIMNGLTSLQGTLQNCCCDIKSNIMENRYLASQNTASINATTTAQTQKILDAIAQNKIESLQAQVNQLQLAQATCGMLRFPNTWTYNGGVFPPVAPTTPTTTG